jgi:Interferon-induced transmembrane protein
MPGQPAAFVLLDQYAADRSARSIISWERHMQPGYPPQGPPPQIDNNMTMSIVSIFLFWPLAIPAIINASKVNTLLQQGDYGGAQQAAAESKRWSKLAIIIGIAWIALVCIGCVAFGGLALLSGSTSSS